MGKRIYNLSYTEEELRKWQEELEALQKTSKYSKTSAGSNNTATQPQHLPTQPLP